MKNVLRHLTALIILTFAMLSLASVYVAAAEAKRPVNKNELNTLLKTAKTSADHLAIAAYYREEAKRLTTSSQEHARDAAIYEKNPPFAALESKHGAAFGQSASHCRHWAKQNAAAAANAETQAALHEEMAKNVQVTTALK